MELKIEGNVEAFSKEKKRVKIDGTWYDVDDKVVNFLRKGHGKIRIKDNKVMFIEYENSQPQPYQGNKMLIVYESMLRTAARLTTAKTYEKKLEQTMEGADKLVEYLKEKGLL